MPIRVVIDTNIWVSALLNPFGFPARLLKSFKEGVFTVIISSPMIEELANVLNRPRIKDRYGITDDDIEELMILIEERTEGVLLSEDIDICRDRNDNFVIETAIKGHAEFLVTRDDDIKSDEGVSSFLSQHGVSVISIAKFLTTINKA
ncbi:MAG: putative toxin-antitoxin system toxin component, PIN family [Nitrospinae bacterium]|nr:putative toxin-antitoxin system toxin component, PIN family [Nitrospinota bacterium]